MHINYSRPRSNLGRALIEMPGPEVIVGEGCRFPGSAANAMHNQSAEVTHWLALVHTFPHIRNDEVARVAGRVAKGFYATRASLDQTAAAMLDG